MTKKEGEREGRREGKERMPKNHKSKEGGKFSNIVKCTDLLSKWKLIQKEKLSQTSKF